MPINTAATADKLLKETSDSTSQVALLEEEKRNEAIVALRGDCSSDMIRRDHSSCC